LAEKEEAMENYGKILYCKRGYNSLLLKGKKVIGTAECQWTYQIIVF
jgi:hypothetical protein